MSRAHLRSFHKAAMQAHAQAHDECPDDEAHEHLKVFHERMHGIHKDHLQKLDGAAEGGGIDRGSGDVPVGNLDGPAAKVYDGDLEKALGIKLP